MATNAEALKQPQVFNSASNRLKANQKECTLLTRQLATRREVTRLSIDELKKIVVARLDRFVTAEHPRVMALLRSKTVVEAAKD